MASPKAPQDRRHDDATIQRTLRDLRNYRPGAHDPARIRRAMVQAADIIVELLELIDQHGSTSAVSAPIEDQPSGPAPKSTKGKGGQP